ncbi:MAG TPA: nuclear transport factor 2 family protein [Steroidobacteraceae bacterium]|jgi:uncharacterized protein (TIGR02246 family)
MLNRWKIALGLGVALGITASIASAATPGVVRSGARSDKAQIEALEARLAAGFNAKDVAKIMSCYARDELFVFDVAPPRQHVGWQDYQKDWESLFGGITGPVTFKISDLDVTAAGSVAYSHSIQDVHWSAAGAAGVEITVRVTDVYRKMAGAWRIVQEHVSVPVDLGTGKGDLMSKP